MSSNKEENFLQEVVRQINFPFDRKSIYKELSGHIEEAKEEYLDQHLDADEASRCALDDMGDPAEIGKSLNKVHRPIWGWLWMISKYTMILLLVSVGFQSMTTLYKNVEASRKREPYTMPVENLFVDYTDELEVEDFVFDEMLAESVELGNHTIFFERITLHKNGTMLLIYQEVVPSQLIGRHSAKHQLDSLLTIRFYQTPLTMVQDGLNPLDGYSVVILKDVPLDCREVYLEYRGYSEDFDLVINIGGSS